MKYVILKHHTEPAHFDLMMDAGNQLWTWSWYSSRFPRNVVHLPLERIQDHRRAYLTYEGPVSGRRGTVKRREEGIIKLHRSFDTVLRGEFQGDKWNFPFELRKQARFGIRGFQQWILTNQNIVFPGSSRPEDSNRP